MVGFSIEPSPISGRAYSQKSTVTGLRIEDVSPAPARLPSDSSLLRSENNERTSPLPAVTVFRF